MDYKQVTREEFRAFLAAYAGRLEHDCISIADPPIHNYCDWSKSTAPIGTGEAHMQAVQAYCIYADERGGKDRFYIRETSGPAITVTAQSPNEMTDQQKAERWAPTVTISIDEPPTGAKP